MYQRWTVEEKRVDWESVQRMGVPVSEPMYGGKGGVTESVEQSVSGGAD